MLADDAFLYHLHRGTELLLQERVDEARQSLEQALRLQPEDIEGQSLLAAVYFRLGLYQRAIESWLDLAERYPQSATLHVNLALSWLKCGDFERAVAAAEQALAQQPEHRRAWRYAGLAHWRLGHLEEAKHALTQADAHQLIAHIEAERLAASHPGAAGDADASAPIAAASPQDLGLAAAQAEAQLRDWPSPL
ncbi:MAG: tetratricopeptide repeat protein, partial [Polyangiales bacterium]